MIYKNNQGEEIEVSLVKEGSSHKYVVSGIEELTEDNVPMVLPSVTTITGSVDGSGTYPISRWYSRLASEKAWDKTSELINELIETHPNPEKPDEIWKIKDAYSAHKDEFINWGINAFDLIKGFSETSEEFINTAKNYPVQQFDKAGDRGTRIHKALEIYLNDGSKLDWMEALCASSDVEFKLDNMASCFHDIKNWIKKEGYSIVAQEIPVFHVELQIAGTIELLLHKVHVNELGEREHWLIVCDFKSGTGIRWKDRLQQMVYVSCIGNMMTHGINMCCEANPPLDDIRFGACLFHIQEEFGVKKTPRVQTHIIPAGMLSDVGVSSAVFLHNASKVPTVKETI